MALSARQAYVLANLERVMPLPYKVTVRHPLARYQLDDRECTAQITGLVVRKQIRECKDGALERLR